MMSFRQEEESVKMTLEELDTILMHSLGRYINSQIIETAKERNLDEVEVARAVVRLIDELPPTDQVYKVRNIIQSFWKTETPDDNAK